MKRTLPARSYAFGITSYLLPPLLGKGKRDILGLRLLT